MNCLEFRRHVGAEPAAPLPAAMAHREECPACAKYQDEMLSLDRLLGRAMRLDLAPASTQPGAAAAPDRWSALRQGVAPSRRWLAMAASLVAGVLVATTLWLSYPGPTLAAEVIGHVVSDPNALEASQPLSAESISEVLEPSHVRLRPGMGTVTFAMRCVFEGQVVPHLVVQTVAGPVTVLLLGHRRVEAPTRIEADGYSAVVLPAPRGSIAIVGRNVAGIDAIAQQVFDSVDWSA
jgi:hypothetical protein